MHKIMIIKIPGVLCPSYGMASNHVHDKTFPHLTTPLLICLHSRFQLDFRLAGLTALQEGRSIAPSSGDDGGPAQW